MEQLFSKILMWFSILLFPQTFSFAWTCRGFCLCNYWRWQVNWIGQFWRLYIHASVREFKPPLPPTNVDYIFYHTNYGIYSNGKKKQGHWTSPETTPPPFVDFVHKNVFFYSIRLHLHRVVKHCCEAQLFAVKKLEKISNLSTSWLEMFTPRLHPQNPKLFLFRNCVSLTLLSQPPTATSVISMSLPVATTTRKKSFSCPLCDWTGVNAAVVKTHLKKKHV